MTTSEGRRILVEVAESTAGMYRRNNQHYEAAALFAIATELRVLNRVAELLRLPETTDAARARGGDQVNTERTSR